MQKVSITIAAILGIAVLLIAVDVIVGSIADNRLASELSSLKQKDEALALTGPPDYIGSWSGTAPNDKVEQYYIFWSRSVILGNVFGHGVSLYLIDGDRVHSVRVSGVSGKNRVVRHH